MRKAGGGSVEPPGPGGDSSCPARCSSFRTRSGPRGTTFPGCRSSASPRSWRSRFRRARRGRPPGGDGSRGRPAAFPSTTGSPTPSRCRGSSAGRSGRLAAFLVSAYVGAYFSVAAAAARRLEGRFGDRGLWLFPAAWTAARDGPKPPVLRVPLDAPRVLRRGKRDAAPGGGPGGRLRPLLPPRPVGRLRLPRREAAVRRLHREGGAPADPRDRGAPVPGPVRPGRSGEPGGSRGPGARGEGGHRPGRDRPVREVGPGEPVGHARDLRGPDATGEGRGRAGWSSGRRPRLRSSTGGKRSSPGGSTPSR